MLRRLLGNIAATRIGARLYRARAPGSRSGHQARHPAWTHNLLAKPAARVEIDGDVVPVTARLTEGEERIRLYRRFEELSPNYREYRDWSRDREIRVFVLERR